jgi:hypothetical protein
MEWKPYIGDRLIGEHEAGFSVVRPQTVSDAMPLFCPMCKSIMRTVYDEDAHRKFQCCDSCSNTWVYPNLDRWKSGWRPTSEEMINKSRDVPI